MRILITGNMGYVGSVLTRNLRNALPAAELTGFDQGFFGHCLTGCSQLPEALLSKQILGDVRNIPEGLIEKQDVVVHLAAVSNDPMGNEFEDVTNEINRVASVQLAKLAAKKGVKNFVFASSCSMYGASEGGPRRETDPTNPLTAYARSKIGTEEDLRSAELGDMVVTSLRFATACGMSDRLRLDLVLNDFVACALSSGKISVLSDGSPWRPLIDVNDMARAILWALQRKASNGGKLLSVNAGKSANNYQVKDLATAVTKHVPGTIVSINKDAPPDKRSYQVDFSLFESLAPQYLPQITLDMSIRQLVEGLRRMGFSDNDFRSSQAMRLNVLRSHMAAGRINQNLAWI